MSLSKRKHKSFNSLTQSQKEKINLLLSALDDAHLALNSEESQEIALAKLGRDLSLLGITLAECDPSIKRSPEDSTPSLEEDINFIGPKNGGLPEISQ